MEGGRAGPARGSHLVLEGGDQALRQLGRDDRESEQDLTGTSLKTHRIFRAEGDVKVIRSILLLVLTFVVLIIKDVEPQKRELAQGHSRTQLLIYHKIG